MERPAGDWIGVTSAPSRRTRTSVSPGGITRSRERQFTMIDEHPQTIHERPLGIDGRRQERLADDPRRPGRDQRLGEQFEPAPCSV